MHISEREQQLPEQVIEKLIQIQAEHNEVLSLGPGEPDFEMPQPLVDYVKTIADKSNHYAPPGGLKILREAVARKLKHENNIETSPDNIVVTCGSQEGLLLASMCCLDVGEEIILPNPGFMDYVPIVELISAVPRFVQLKEEHEFEFNPADVEKAIDSKRTKAIMINTPANPTGTVLSRRVLEQLADIAIEHDLYIFSDEAYEKIIYDDAKHISIGSLNGMQDHVVTFQTFSKSHAMCGFRLGYLAAPEALAEAARKTHVHTTICAPTISQLLGVKALSLPAYYTNRMVAEYDRRRRFIVKRLNEIGLRTLMPKGAFYTFSSIKHLHTTSKQFSMELLKAAKVAVVPGIDFGRHGEGYIRCSYATDIKVIEKAMERLEHFVKRKI